MISRRTNPDRRQFDSFRRRRPGESSPPPDTTPDTERLISLDTFAEALAAFADVLPSLRRLSVRMQLTRRWATHGFRTPCGRMWKLPTRRTDRRGSVSVASAKEWLWLIVRHELYPPPHCECPHCLELEAPNITVVYDPYPPLPPHPEPLGYVTFWTLYGQKLSEHAERDAADPNEPK